MSYFTAWYKEKDSRHVFFTFFEAVDFWQKYKTNRTIFGEKDRFLSMDAGGVKKVKASLGVYTRLNTLLNFKTSGLKELTVDYNNTWYNKDDIHLSKFMESSNLVSVLILNCKYDLLGSSRIVTNMNTMNTVVLGHCNLSCNSSLTSLNGVHPLNTIVTQGCCILVDEEVAKAVAKLPCIKEVNLFGNILVEDACTFCCTKLTIYLTLV